MYLDPFNLKELPFRLSPDPQFLYLSKQHARAKAYMESTIWFTDGFVVITGEIGSGKTTLIESFLKEIQSDVVVAQINQTQVSAIDFLQTVLVQFGFSPFKMKKGELIATLNNFLIEQYAAGRKVLLIVDEAQNLTLRVLEEIRLLSGVETTKEKVLRIILAGQPELNAKLDAPELVQLTQRVRLRFHLTALSESETRGYIQHRLEVAGGGDRAIFAEETFPEIYRYTGGVPRLINTLCDTAMMAAYAADRGTVALDDITSAVEELQWIEFAARTQQQIRAAVEHAPARVHRPESASPTLAPLARLLVATDGRTVQEMSLAPGRVIVGRTSDNDLQIDSRFVSRHHCQITTTANSCVIEDLNSTNGIYVKSRRVRRHYLNDGDVVLVGKHELIYVDERLVRTRTSLNDTVPSMPALQPPPEGAGAAGEARADERAEAARESTGGWTGIHPAPAADSPSGTHPEQRARSGPNGAAARGEDELEGVGEPGFESTRDQS
jgi:general secretion pathway protein A